MSLAPGVRLGAYEVSALIGAGGMGEVYKARDTRLDRTVAIKVLPGHVASDPDLLQRFDREARAVAALNHPHICTLHDIGHQDGVDYLVMEYLDGESLADRIAKGPLPLDQALRYAIEMADALAAAHRAGIIHRDLKPGNIILTKAGAKLLDFGLAKTDTSVLGGTNLSRLPTTPPITQQGTILGTFQYMAPEQLEGREADARTDIFALGAVVYEMITGKKAFEGKSQASLIGAIMHAEPPPISGTQPLAPPVLDHILRRSLAKEPDERWQTASDLMRELQWSGQIGSVAGAVQAPRAASIRGRTLPWVVVVSSLVTAVLFGFLHFRARVVEPQPLIRFEIAPPPSVTFSGQFSALAVSPDGRFITYWAAGRDGRSVLWVRALDSAETRPLPGTEASSPIPGVPFWSPDSRFIVFGVGGKIKRVEPAGGPPQTISDNSPAPFGGSWNRDGVLIFGTRGGGLWKVSASGGTASALTTLDNSLGDIQHQFPYFLPDGRHFMYQRRTARPNTDGIYVGILDTEPDKWPSVRVLEATAAVFAPPRDGNEARLVFVRDGALMAQTFDTPRLQMTGEPVQIAEQMLGLGGQPGLSVSDTGVLAFRRTASQGAQLTWFDRQGNAVGDAGEPGLYQSVDLAPDGRRLGVAVRDPETQSLDIWMRDLARRTTTRLTFDPRDDLIALWSADQTRIVFNSNREGAANLYQKLASGTGNDTVLLRSDTSQWANDWSFDGRFVLYSQNDDAGPSAARVMSLWILPMNGGKSRRYLETTSKQGQFSPDTKFVAYMSNETGTPEIYVQPFPDPSTGKWMISQGGGVEPRWRRDGRELFYLSGQNVMSVDVSAEPSFSIGVPKVLFSAPIAAGYANDSHQWQVAPDGQRFLMLTLPVDKAVTPITVVLNWTAALKK